LLTADARALFERTVSKLSPQAARPLFDRFYKYECEYGETGAIRKLSKRIADLYPEGIILKPLHLTAESNLRRFMTRHTTFGVNPVAIYDLPPSLPPAIPEHPAPAHDEDVASVISSRANSVQPSDMDDSKRLKLDRFGRHVRERTNSPDPRTTKKKSSNKRELPRPILEFLAALPPANMFDGATFHVDELVKLIRDVNVPYPAGFIVKTKRARGSDDDEGPARGIKKYRDD
jgi:cleavage stimulation factor subunit 3